MICDRKMEEVLEINSLLLHVLQFQICICNSWMREKFEEVSIIILESTTSNHKKIVGARAPEWLEHYIILFCNIKMSGKSKDTLDIKHRQDTSIVPLKSCILISTPDGEKFVKKAKSVHFADALGKPLKSIKTLYDLEDELDLFFLGFNKSVTRRNFSIKPRKTEGMTCQFVNFICQPKFLEQVMKHNVLLENITVQENGILGTIMVKNISFEKAVTVTFTLNKWKTVYKVKANFVPGSNTGIIDIFSFEITLPETEINLELQFAICFKVEETEYWDSNHSKNYILSLSRKTEQKKNIAVDSINCKGFVVTKQDFIGWGS